MDTIDHLRAAFDAAAERTGYSRKTIGRMVGQGGAFYDRLLSRQRVWPETAAAVLLKLQSLPSKPRRCDASHGHASAPAQGRRRRAS